MRIHFDSILSPNGQTIKLVFQKEQWNQNGISFVIGWQLTSEITRIDCMWIFGTGDVNIERIGVFLQNYDHRWRKPCSVPKHLSRVEWANNLWQTWGICQIFSKSKVRNTVLLVLAYRDSECFLSRCCSSVFVEWEEEIEKKNETGFTSAWKKCKRVVSHERRMQRGKDKRTILWICFERFEVSIFEPLKRNDWTFPFHSFAFQFFGVSKRANKIFQLENPTNFPAWHFFGDAASAFRFNLLCSPSGI